MLRVLSLRLASAAAAKGRGAGGGALMVVLLPLGDRGLGGHNGLPLNKSGSELDAS